MQVAASDSKLCQLNVFGNALVDKVPFTLIQVLVPRMLLDALFGFHSLDSGRLTLQFWHDQTPDPGVMSALSHVACSAGCCNVPCAAGELPQTKFH